MKKSISIIDVYRLLFVMFLMFGCKKDNLTTPDIDNNNGAPDIETYFQRFINEGNARGENIPQSLNGIEAEFDEFTEPGIIGLCTRVSNGTNRVVIDQTFWDNADDLQKERIVFHELGHCYLNRNHKNGTLANGYCNSMMNAGGGNLYRAVQHALSRILHR